MQRIICLMTGATLGIVSDDTPVSSVAMRNGWRNFVVVKDPPEKQLDGGLENSRWSAGDLSLVTEESTNPYSNTGRLMDPYRRK